MHNISGLTVIIHILLYQGKPIKISRQQAMAIMQFRFLTITVDTTSCIAVNNVALCQDCEEEVTYYPNPVIDFLHIKNIQKQNDFNIQVLDLSRKYWLLLKILN